MKPSILVTGAAGCIGSNFCEYLVKNTEYHVIALDDLSGSNESFFADGCEKYIRDVGSDLTDIFEKYNVRIVYHMAAIAAESASPFMRKFYYTSNIVNSANVINYCIKYNVDRLVFFSSMAVYGNNETPFVESQTPAPIDPYGIGKYAVEMDLHCARVQHGLKWTIVRPHSVYGPKQNIWDKYRNVLGIWMRQILNDEPISIYGEGVQRRAFTYVDDIMLPLLLCGEDEDTLYETFNIGSDLEMTLMEVAQVLEQVSDKPIEYKFYPGIHEASNAYSNHDLAAARLGLRCQTGIREGLKKMWEWAKVQTPRDVKKFDFELTNGLYKQFQ